MPIFRLARVAAFSVLLSPAVAALAQEQALPVVGALDLDRYLGRWHEIARYPNYFERMCASEVTAEYSRNADGTLKVVNACLDDTGKQVRAEGVARIVAPPAKLEVRFAPAWLSWLPLVWADYWVIDIADDYSYAVVSEPGRDYLWILGRDPLMSDARYEAILSRLAKLGFDPARLVRNPVR
jgi:apolipoprotein D and lipocalin family protein